MTKLFDEIHEELKREDFLRKLFRILPYAGIFVLSTLISIGLYTWNQHRQEEHLYRLEQVYKKAVHSIETGNFSVARQNLDKLILEPYGLGLLSHIYQLVLGQKTFRMTEEEKDFQDLSEKYHLFLKGQPLGESLETFLMASLSLTYLEAHRHNEMLKKRIKLLGTPEHSWISFALLYDVLDAFQGQDKQNLQDKLTAWEKGTSQEDPGYWLPMYCAIGAGTRRTIDDDHLGAEE